MDKVNRRLDKVRTMARRLISIKYVESTIWKRWTDKLLYGNGHRNGRKAEEGKESKTSVKRKFQFYLKYFISTSDSNVTQDSGFIRFYTHTHFFNFFKLFTAYVITCLDYLHFQNIIKPADSKTATD